MRFVFIYKKISRSAIRFLNQFTFGISSPWGSFPMYMKVKCIEGELEYIHRATQARVASRSLPATIIRKEKEEG